MQVINTTQIMKILPHRYPFLMVDKAEILKQGKSIIGYKNVTVNEYFFIGHFPEEAVMPGVLIIESMAQTGAVLILSIHDNLGKTAYFGGIKNARFRSKVVPGCELRLEFVVTENKNNIVTGMSVAYVQEKVVCEAEVYFVVKSLV